MELRLPPMLAYRDSRGFWKVVIVFLAWIPAWQWLTGYNWNDSASNCCLIQDQALCGPSCGDTPTTWMSEDGSILPCDAGSYQCILEASLQYVSKVRPTAICSRSALYTDSLQQCPLPSETRAGLERSEALNDFTMCIINASGANELSSGLGNTESKQQILRTCAMEFVGSVTPKSGDYLPEPLRNLQRSLPTKKFINIACKQFNGCCDILVQSAGQLLRAYQSASSANVTSLLKVDWQEKIQQWPQDYVFSAVNYIKSSSELMLPLFQSGDTIAGLRFTYEHGFRSHLGTLGDLCHRTTRAISVPTISANRLLPQKSNWIFRKRVASSKKAIAAEHTPEHTPKPALKFLQGSSQAPE